MEDRVLLSNSFCHQIRKKSLLGKHLKTFSYMAYTNVQDASVTLSTPNFSLTR